MHEIMWPPCRQAWRHFPESNPQSEDAQLQAVRANFITKVIEVFDHDKARWLNVLLPITAASAAAAALPVPPLQPPLLQLLGKCELVPLNACKHHAAEPSLDRCREIDCQGGPFRGKPWKQILPLVLLRQCYTKVVLEKLVLVITVATTTCK